MESQDYFKIFYYFFSYGSLIFLFIRFLQRCYYWRKGHRPHRWTHSPKKELDHLLSHYHVKVTKHKIISTLDKSTIAYRRIGTGKHVHLLENGVGTGFFMWLPLIRCLLALDKHLFDKITLLVPDYRGMFVENDDNFQTEVKITVAHCMQDIKDVMKDAEVPVLDGIIGWSTGAQIGLAFTAKYPTEIKRLMLFNPSVGKTLHTCFQPYHPLPHSIGQQISRVMNYSLRRLKLLIPTNVWVYLKAFNDSIYFYWALYVVSLASGFPPDQPVYFYEYMRDAFSTRTHTRHLLDLILSLDEELPKEIFHLTHPVLIFSGSPDFLTGVYQSIKLEKYLKNSFRMNFTMGSHWLILEWPELIAEYVLDFLLFHDTKLKLLCPTSSTSKSKVIIENQIELDKKKEE